MNQCQSMNEVLTALLNIVIALKTVNQNSVANCIVLILN